MVNMHVPDFLSSVTVQLPKVDLMVDGVYIERPFTKTPKNGPRKEHCEKWCPKSLRRVLLKSLGDENLTVILPGTRCRSECDCQCLDDQGAATLDPAGPNTMIAPVAYHELRRLGKQRFLRRHR